ncbi:MAG: NUDIX domain-containing protein [Spirochaetales bacterium]|nr:NUDIX domain-containing protein [Spirochaetales bacterium]
MKEKTKPDMCVPCGDGLLNIRVGALITRDGKLLMVQSGHDYLYSVGGRIKMGETAQEAVVREVLEETGVKMSVRRLIAVHENYFYGDMPSNQGKPVYEISFYFQMDVPDGFMPVCGSVTADGEKEYLRWVSPDTPMTVYPDFFRQMTVGLPDSVLFFTTDER